MCYDMSILIVKTSDVKTNICQMSEMTYFFKYFFFNIKFVLRWFE